MLTDVQIEHGKTNALISEPPHFEHNDCIRMAYEWLDAQAKTKKQNPRMVRHAVKHIIEEWCGRYVSASDVEVAAWLHHDVFGKYPNFNISSRLTLPSIGRLSTIGEAGKHKPIGGIRSKETYKSHE